MKRKEIQAHHLANWIEWQHAKSLSRATKGRQSAEYLYDPLAATCLGNLLYDELCRAEGKPENQP